MDFEIFCINLGFVFGGVDFFVLVVKFCYGIDVEFILFNVVGFCCVLEFFEMLEMLEEGNVSSKVEVYFNFVVFNLWYEFMVVFIFCEYLFFWVEDF